MWWGVGSIVSFKEKINIGRKNYKASEMGLVVETKFGLVEGCSEHDGTNNLLLCCKPEIQEEFY